MNENSVSRESNGSVSKALGGVFAVLALATSIWAIVSPIQSSVTNNAQDLKDLRVDFGEKVRAQNVKVDEDLATLRNILESKLETQFTRTEAAIIKLESEVDGVLRSRFTAEDGKNLDLRLREVELGNASVHSLGTQAMEERRVERQSFLERLRELEKRIAILTEIHHAKQKYKE